MIKHLINYLTNLSDRLENYAANISANLADKATGRDLVAGSKGKATITARVYRKAENKWYDLGEVSNNDVRIVKRS